MLKILFHSIDGVGLGHVMRGINIAKEVRKLFDCEIIFVTNTPFTEMINQENFKFIKGGVDPYRLFRGTISSSEYYNLNEEFLLTSVKEFHPDIIIFDVLIPTRVLHYVNTQHIFSVYILREINNPNYLIQHKKDLLSLDLILITGINNFPFLDPSLNKSLSGKNIYYVDNIFREPNKNVIKHIKSKYQKKPDEILITVTAGGGAGGGCLKEVRIFFKFIIDIASKIDGPITKEKPSNKKLRWVVIKGPLYHCKNTFPSGFKIYDYEKNLPELFAVSDLVVSTGGYNTISEIIAAKVPALVYPLPSIMDSQTSRVSKYIPNGFIQILDINNLEASIKLFQKTLNSACLNKLKKNYDNYIHLNGNRLSAAIIFKKFFEYKKDKFKIGVLGLDITETSAAFIETEIENSLLYEPIFLYGKNGTRHDEKENYYFEDYYLTRFKNFHLPVFSKESLERYYSVAATQTISLLHSQFLTDTVSYLPLINKLKLPLVVNFRGYELSDPRAKLFFSKAEPLISYIIVKSNFQKNLLIKSKVSEEKIITIYGGIGVDKVPFKLRNIDKKKLKILSAGRFIEKKGFDITLKFFKLLLQKYPQSHLTLIGEGVLKPELEKYIRSTGIEDRVRIQPFMPHSDFIKNLFNYDIFVLLSRTASNGDIEGIPNVLKEAMASGMPVISTYHAGIPELIEDGKTGFLVNENDFYGVLKKLEWILANNKMALEICLNARFFIEKKFNNKETSKEIESLYNRLLMPDYVRTIFEVKEGRKPIHFRADLHLISGCSGRCVMCENWENEIISKFSRKDISRLLDNLKSFGVDYVRFHGQEPTLNKDLFAVMREAKDKGFRVGLKTNALFFNTDQKIKKLATRIDDLYLSIDSSAKEIHNFLRGKSESFTRNTNLSRNIKKVNPHIKVFFNAVVTKLNYKNLIGLIEFAYSLKADKVSFVHLNTKNKKNIEKISLTKQQFKEFYATIWPQILEKSLAFNIPVSIDPYFDTLSRLSLKEQIHKLKENFYESEEEINNFSKGLYGKKFYSLNICYGVLDHVTIDWEGNVYPCCAMPRLPSLSMGNVIKDTFHDIWNNKEYQKYRQEVIEGKCKFKDECSRNFKHSTEINNYFKKENYNNHAENIISEYWNQYRYNEYMAKYKFMNMIYYAFTHSEFYHKKFENNFDPAKRSSVLDLPIIKKSDLRGVFPSEQIVPNYFEEKYGIFRTSSCGSQSFLYANSLKSTRYYRMATCFLNTGKWKANTPWIKLTALNCLETAEPLVVGQSCEKVDLDEKKSNAIVISPSENFLGEPKQMIKKAYYTIFNSGSRLIHANPSYLKLLLYRFWKENLIFPDNYVINSTYELLLPSTKRLIEKYLNCNVYDQYGCSEVGPISFTCRYGNYHIFSESVYVEVMPAADLGRMDIGRVIVTDLENKVMPFIRYFTGDFCYITEKKSCKCDLRTPIMGRIIGREEEMITYGGKPFFPFELDSIFSDIKNVLMYQILFKNEEFLIKVVPEDKFQMVPITIIIDRFKHIFADKKCKVNIAISEFILPNRRGKYNSVIVK